MSNFWQRAITGVFFVVVLLGAVLWNKYSFISLFFVVCVLGLREYAVLFKDRKYKPNFGGTVIGGGGIALIWAIHYLHISYTLFEPYETGLLFGFLAFPVIVETVGSKKPSLNNVGLSLAGITYLNLGIIFFTVIGNLCREDMGSGFAYNCLPVLGFLLLLWSSDTFAYITGRAFGKTPLAPKISPKKTWEGSIGGAICTVLLSCLLFKTIGYLHLYQWIGLAIIIVVFGTIGDLTESRFKRVLGVKDSGNILPGHGGILDRFDSLLFASPFAAIFLVITSNC